MMPRFEYIRALDEIEAEMGQPELSDANGSPTELSNIETQTNGAR
jgi:hypothetical protein